MFRNPLIQEQIWPLMSSRTLAFGAASKGVRPAFRPNMINRERHPSDSLDDEMIAGASASKFGEPNLSLPA